MVTLFSICCHRFGCFGAISVSIKIYWCIKTPAVALRIACVLSDTDTIPIHTDFNTETDTETSVFGPQNTDTEYKISYRFITTTNCSMIIITISDVTVSLKSQSRSIEIPNRLENWSRTEFGIEKKKFWGRNHFF